jgi:hypothetical protein
MARTGSFVVMPTCTSQFQRVVVCVALPSLINQDEWTTTSGAPVSTLALLQHIDERIELKHLFNEQLA